MNERQRRFAEAYAADPNATRAAVAAGYSAKTARSIGAENLTKPDIAEYIKALQAEADAERVAKIDEVQRFWTATMRDADERIENRLRASENLAKAGAAFTQRVEVEATVEAEIEEDIVFYIPENGRKIITDDEQENKK